MRTGERPVILLLLQALTAKKAPARRGEGYVGLGADGAGNGEG
jgi:hypothetical protein